MDLYPFFYLFGVTDLENIRRKRIPPELVLSKVIVDKNIIVGVN